VLKWPINPISNPNPTLKIVTILKMNLKEIGWGGMDWIDLAQDRDQWRALVNKIMNLRVP
jgi:hypothetical protein